MVRQIAATIALFGLLISARAQGPNDPNAGSRLTKDALTTAYTFAW